MTWRCLNITIIARQINLKSVETLLFDDKFIALVVNISVKLQAKADALHQRIVKPSTLK